VPTACSHLEGLDLGRLPYPVALTAGRLLRTLESSHDALKTLFTLKDCFEATIKYLGAVLLVEYLRSPAATPERNEALLQKMVRPSLGVWVSTVVGDLSRCLVTGEGPGGRVASLFARPGKGPRNKPLFTPLLQRCEAFVAYRNDALGLGAMCPNRVLGPGQGRGQPRESVVDRGGDPRGVVRGRRPHQPRRRRGS
jgi:hypothetical protein